VSLPRADALSPIDAATLWPQLHRLKTEVIATRVGENMLFRAGLAATGLGNLPRLPRTLVLGVRRGLSYRGVIVARELAGGAAWQVVSLRIARVTDDEAVAGLLVSAGNEIAMRSGRAFFLRYSESSPHEDGILHGAMTAYTREHLFATPNVGDRTLRTEFRPIDRRDRAGLFRLYCEVVPDTIRRVEAPTQAEWRGVFDSYDLEHEWVHDSEGRLHAWVGIGEHEARMLCDGAVWEEGLTLIHRRAGQVSSLVVGEHQERLAGLADECGFVPLGTRMVAARQLAARNPLKEAARVRSYPVPN
jgi:hypothetical protein